VEKDRLTRAFHAVGREVRITDFDPGEFMACSSAETLTIRPCTEESLAPERHANDGVAPTSSEANPPTRGGAVPRREGRAATAISWSVGHLAIASTDQLATFASRLVIWRGWYAAWLRTHEAEETTLDGYRGYVRRTIEPVLGSVPLAKVSAQVLEEFYADLRRCRHQCRDGKPAVDHRTAMEHECRTVRHKRRPGRPGRELHDCAAAGCVVVECPPHRCRPMAASSIQQVHWIISAV
jgi:hypothetical protein